MLDDLMKMLESQNVEYTIYKTFENYELCFNDINGITIKFCFYTTKELKEVRVIQHD